jgi:hypothetical protein
MCSKSRLLNRRRQWRRSRQEFNDIVAPLQDSDTFVVRFDSVLARLTPIRFVVPKRVDDEGFGVFRPGIVDGLKGRSPAK